MEIENSYAISQSHVSRMLSLLGGFSNIIFFFSTMKAERKGQSGIFIFRLFFSFSQL